MDPALECLGNEIRALKRAPLAIAVGDVKDYTGKYSQNEGNTITQGGALMAYSALGKLGDAIQLQERFDTRIAELELAYIDRRQLGDGQSHSVQAGKPAVPWVPYFGGSILRSNYYIVGGITEVNYNIASGGAEFEVNGVGPKRRTYTMNIGVDLRIVDTRTLAVARTVSLQKQIVGEEIGAGVYRFFGNSLVDVNVGAKNQEPLQLGVRTTIEEGVLDLVSAVAGVDGKTCLVRRPKPNSKVSARPSGGAGNGRSESLPVPKAGDVAVTSVPHPVRAESEVSDGSGLVPQNAGPAVASGSAEVGFEFGNAAVSSEASATLDRIANDLAQGRSSRLQLIARDTESWPPQKRQELTHKRIQSVVDALGTRGVKASSVRVQWMPAATESAITRYRAGYQLVATLSIAP